MRKILATVAVLSLFAGSSAHGQIWIGELAGRIAQARNHPDFEAERRCMSGQAAPTGEDLARLEQAASERMDEYVVLVRSASTVDVRDAYSRRPKQPAWQLNGVAAPLSAVSDPLARAMNEGGSFNAHSFQASGDRESAIGIWVVRNSLGEAAGHYRAVFEGGARSRGLASLQIVEGTQEPIELGPYCHNPGDTQEYLTLYDANGDYIGPPPQDGPSLVGDKRGAP